jgi:hypothetical protein
MCGRFTNKLTWDDIVRLYRLTLNAPPHNLRPRYNVCPTDTIDTIVFEQGVRNLFTMRWGLAPRWWSKPLKEIKLATFNARAETVSRSRFFEMRLSAHAVSFPFQAITSGRIPRAANNLGISRRETAPRRSRSRGFGMNGKIPRRANR